MTLSHEVSIPEELGVYSRSGLFQEVSIPGGELCATPIPDGEGVYKHMQIRATREGASWKKESSEEERFLLLTSCRPPPSPAPSEVSLALFA